MELSLTNIGNSKGVILPKTLLLQFGFKDQIHVELTDRGIVLTPAVVPAAHPRAGWAEQIEKALAADPQALEVEDPEWLEVWDDDVTEEWTWDGAPEEKATSK